MTRKQVIIALCVLTPALYIWQPFAKSAQEIQAEHFNTCVEYEAFWNYNSYKDEYYRDDTRRMRPGTKKSLIARAVAACNGR